jgi:hypothetical protein
MYLANRSIRYISPKSTPLTNPNAQQVKMLEDLVEFSTEAAEIAIIHQMIIVLWNDPTMYYDAYR